MYQNKSHVVALDPEHHAEQRLASLQQALIAQRVPSGHELFLQAPSLEDLPIGRWGQEHCSVEDLQAATTILIRW